MVLLKANHIMGCAQLILLTLLNFVGGSIFVSDVKMNKMIELNARKPHCRLHTDRGEIQSTVLNTDPLKIRQVPVETITSLEEVCFEGNQLSGEIQGKHSMPALNQILNLVYLHLLTMPADKLAYLNMIINNVTFISISKVE